MAWFSSSQLRCCRSYACSFRPVARRPPSGHVLRLALDVALEGSADHRTRYLHMHRLSGAFNRRYFEARLEEELQRASRHDIPLAVLQQGVNPGAEFAAGVGIAGWLPRPRECWVGL